MSKSKSKSKHKLISRAEVLAGLGGRAEKRAYVLLALIENRTAELVAQQHAPSPARVMVPLSQGATAYLAAYGSARHDLPPPTIQEIERFAPHWAALVPESAPLRATLAALLGEKYRFTAQAVPAIRQSLGLDQPAVEQAYQQNFNQSLSKIYVTEITQPERTRWAWATIARRLETLPPFWLTFFLTIPGAAGLLALPIALADVSLGWGLGLILLFGLINLVTAVALAETVVRSGTARFGLGFLGQLAQEYLGRELSALLTVVMIANNFLVLIIFFLGVGGTLADSIGGPLTLWLLPIFVITLYFLSRRSLNTTIAVTLLIVWINLLMLLLIPLVSLPLIEPGQLLSRPSGSLLAPATLGLIIGILSSTFLSHFLVATYGPVILPRDPGGRAWMAGTAAALLFFTLVGCLWLVVVKGVLPTATLLSTTGTILQPLAARVGPLIHLFGTLLVILSMGLTTIQVALGQYYLIEERLPRPGSRSWVGQLPDWVRFAIGASPLLAILLIAEWLAISGTGSFAALLGILGALALPLIIGIIPLLLLLVTRRQGDFVPQIAPRWLGHWLLVALLYAFFVGMILVHGLYIWQGWGLRLFALGGGLLIMAITIRRWRQGFDVGRTVIELCHDERLHGESHLRVVSNGQPCAVDVVLHLPQALALTETTYQPLAEFSRLRSIALRLPPAAIGGVKVWVHHLTPAGYSEAIPANVLFEQEETQPAQIERLPLNNGQLLGTIASSSEQIVIYLKES